MRIDERGVSLHHLDAATLRELTDAARELADHLLLNEGAELFQIELRFAERDAVLGHLVRFADDLRGVEKCFRGNATAIEADAAELRVFVDERDLHPVIGGVQRRRVSAGAAADDE